MTQAPAPARPRRGRGSLAARLFPGDRRIWLTAAAVLGAGAIVVLIALFLPRDYYTGTNSVRTRSYEVELTRGDELCVRGLNVPAGTGRVQLQADTGGGPHPALTGRLRSGGQTSPPVRVAGRPEPGPRKVSFAVPRRPGSPESARGDFCVRAEGKVFFGGMGDVQAGDTLPTVNGKPVPDRVAVWFLPPAGEKRSLISHFGEIVERASLFRPGFAGPAFYWLLLLVFVPGLAYGAVRLLATAEGRGVRRLAIGVALLAFGNAAAWAFITPSFNSPDESEHFAYVQYFAETGKGVQRAGAVPPRPVYSSDQTTALDAVRLFSSNEVADGKPPWLKIEEERWRERRAAAPRAPPRDDGGGSTPATTSHSPAYYALLAPAYTAAGGGSTWDQLTAGRLTSALFGAIVALCAFLLVRQFAPRHPVPAVAAGLLVGFHPLFSFMSGSINNDMGVNAAAAVVILLVVRGLMRGLSWRSGAALGAAIALLPVLKGTGYALYPLLLLAFAAMLLRHHSRADLRGYVGLAGGFVAAYVAWAVVSSAFDQSTVTTPGGVAPGNSAFSDPSGYLSYLWQIFLPPLPFMTDLLAPRWPFWDIYIVRGWGAFGWYAITFPLWVYAAIFLVTLVVGGLGAKLLATHRDRLRRDWPALLFLIAVPVVIIAAVEAAYWAPSQRPVIPEFGRYLFPAVSALAAMAVGACFALGRRWAPVAATALVGGMIVLNFASQLLTLAGFYSG